MQIGTVFASEEYVCPNAVGVDIGCGMCAVPVDGLHKDDLSLHDKLQLQSLIKVHGRVSK
jgi:tRNA-splicing ligase RtcB (3'-phosphate/5'-hydroxy nucleic acid ligase)